ncbi:MAG: sigma-54-dependent Fis family transcriptional regulator [Bdellovibrionales bacterium]|nr:sigma-54-dependent Fis family transcriptional regulator [Bdellovibrionales bacterium]
MQERAQILVVDDEQQMQTAMEAVLARMGHAVLKAENGKQALEILERAKPDLVISDMRMPVMTGSELLAKIREGQPQLPVVMITAYGTIEQAVEAMRNGAFDFITKPFSAEELERVVTRAINPVKRATATREIKEAKRDSLAIVTSDAAFKRVLEIAVSVAQSSASVLIQGESGTGKELIARLIHTSSAQATGPFVAVNCAALPENLLESELFGHEKGSFTGAVGTKIGKFEQANGGTILLDEISEMELPLQAKLLRVLQEREVDRIGGQKPIPVDVRVVATTNRDIRQSVAKGDFREDLYYRLNVIPLYVPPLRDRRGDVQLLLEHFVRTFAGGNPRKITPELLNELKGYPWPGNVRELQNACERAVLLAQGDKLEAQHFLLGALRDAPGEEGGSDALRLHSGLSVAEAERRLIFETLRATNNNKTKAAELLGISIRTLRNKLHEYGGDSA